MVITRPELITLTNTMTVRIYWAISAIKTCIHIRSAMKIESFRERSKARSSHLTNTWIRIT